MLHEKILLNFIILLAFVSCDRDKTQSHDDQLPKNTTPVSFNISTDKNLSNLQVDDMLPVKFNITDSDTLNVTYVIKPETENAVFHQKLGVDFYLKQKKTNGNSNSFFSSSFTSVQEIKLTPKQLNGTFFIHILRPGTFQHKYILEKYVNGVKKEETSKLLVFSAVKITAWTYHQEVRSPGLFQHSIHRRYWIFTIDDGHEQFDNYLTTGNGKTHTYTALYAGINHHQGDGSISAHQEKEYRFQEEKEVTAPDIPSLVIESLSVQQKQPDGTINNIVYKNIPIEIK